MADEIYKSVVIDGENYTIRKFTSIQGLQLVRFIIAKLSPLIPILDGTEELLSDEGVFKLMDVFSSISDEDLANVITKCLKCCYKVLPAGNQAVMDAAGHYGVEGIEYDMIKTVQLCFEAIKWGCSSFFDEKGSALIARALAQLSFQPSPSTTTPSSSPQ